MFNISQRKRHLSYSLVNWLPFRLFIFSTILTILIDKEEMKNEDDNLVLGNNDDFK